MYIDTGDVIYEVIKWIVVTVGLFITLKYISKIKIANLHHSDDDYISSIEKGYVDMHIPDYNIDISEWDNEDIDTVDKESNDTIPKPLRKLAVKK